MTNYELIKQLKSLKSINPEKEWVDLSLAKLISDFEENKRPLSLLSIAKMFNVQIQSRMAYSAMAAFVAIFGSLSALYNGAILGDMDRIAANLYFSTPISKVKIIVENNENTVDGVVANEVEKIAKDAGASYIHAQNLNNNNSNNETSTSQISDKTYTVIFKEGSDSKERFTRLLKDRVEVKLYELTQAIKDKDENIKQQIGSILIEAGEAFSRGELIAALELVSAAEKSLASIE